MKRVSRTISQSSADYLRELSKRVASLECEALNDLDREVIIAMLEKVASDADPRWDWYEGPVPQEYLRMPLDYTVRNRTGRPGRPSVALLRAEIARYIEMQFDKGENLESIKSRLLRWKLTEDQIRRAMSQKVRKEQRRFLDSLSPEDRMEFYHPDYCFAPDMTTIHDRMRKK